MKHLILSLIFTCFFFKVSAQTVNVDTSLKFNRGYGEHEWVVLKKADTSKYYTFGYVYIDSLDGLIFQKEGTFIIDKKSRYVRNPATVKLATDRVVLYPVRNFMQGSIRLHPPVALLPVKHFRELKIKAEPDWVKPYYNYTDTLAHNYKWACIYGNAWYTYDAIDYLLKIYKVDPHYIGAKQKIEFGYYLGCQGVELKLAWTYYAIQQPDKAIAILKSAISFDPKNPFFYIVLGFSYDQKENWEMAIDAYKHGLQLMGKEKSELKSNFAYGISNDYHALKNDDEGKNWRAKGDEYNPCPGCVY